MKTCFNNAPWVVLGIISLYIAIVLADSHLFLYFTSILICIYSFYRIVVPFTKESKEATGIGEKYLLTYSKKSGLLGIAYGILILILLSIYDMQNLYGLIWVFIVTCSYIFLSFYLRRIYREINKDEPKKNSFANGIAIFLLIYALFLISIAIFPNVTKSVILFHNNINTSDIIYEYRADTDSSLETTFLLYLKNDKEIGFVRMEPLNVNILFPFLPFRVYAYSFNSKYVIDINSGNTNIILDRGRIERFNDKDARQDNIRLGGSYWYIIRETSSEIRKYNRRFAYMGIKHEFIEMEEIDYRFIQYFDEIFDGIYLYFFVSYEQLDGDFYLESY